MRSDEVPQKWAFWRLAALVPLTALWANLHGSFVLALLLVTTMLGAGAVDDYSVNRPLHRRSLRDLALVLVGCALATLVNPRGAAIYRYVVEIASNAQVHLAREWQTPTHHDAESVYILLVLSLATASSFKRARLGDLALIVPFGLLEMMAVRNGIWLSIILAPIISTRIFTGDRAPTAFSFRGALLVALACLFIPWIKPLLVPRPYGSLAWEPRTPLNAVADFAREQTPPKRVFARAGFGGYVMFSFPSARVFVDSRLELYPKQIWDELAATDDGDLAALDRYDVDCVLVSRHDEPHLREALAHSDSFELHYEDEDVSTFVRRSR